MTEWMGHSALELGQLVRCGQLRPTELVQAAFAAVCEKNPQLNAVIRCRDDRALAEAKAVEERLRAGESLSPLAGVPVLVKDNISMVGEKLTCASAMLENYIAEYDAFVVERLRQAGLIIAGKTNMDAFAMGSTGETSRFGPVRLPMDPARAAGGSSSGSAAAVAAGMIPLSLGTDTGGSIRLPASWCGIWGFKPTYGAVSRYGMVAHASSLEQIGPMARSAADLSALFSVICAQDPRDMTCHGNAAAGEVPQWSGLRIAVPEQMLVGCVDEVEQVFLKVLEGLRALGAAVEFVSVPAWNYALAAYYVIACAEASSNLARYDGLRCGLEGSGADFDSRIRNSRGRGFEDEVLRRILLGTHVLSAAEYEQSYLRAKGAAGELRQALDTLLTSYDLILGPTAKTAAPLLTDCAAARSNAFLSDANTVCANLTGLPALNMPAGRTDQGLPIGVQLIGRRCEDAALLKLAEFLEKEGVSGC